MSIQPDENNQSLTPEELEMLVLSVFQAMFDAIIQTSPMQAKALGDALQELLAIAQHRQRPQYAARLDYLYRLLAGLEARQILRETNDNGPPH